LDHELGSERRRQRLRGSDRERENASERARDAAQYVEKKVLGVSCRVGGEDARKGETQGEREGWMEEGREGRREGGIRAGWRAGGGGERGKIDR